MPSAATTPADIAAEIAVKRAALDRIHRARIAVNGATTRPSPIFAELSMTAPPSVGHRSFHLLAQGDSWFDYPPGTDLVNCLQEKHGHFIDNIAVAGSTLNDEAYGPVPHELFGLPGVGGPQSDEVSRIAELVDRIQQAAPRPDALLLSAGGNDVAGDEFFTFINNAQSGLTTSNAAVIAGAVATFRTAYEFIIDHALAAAAASAFTLPIFAHGYDYPWPDGRGLLNFIGWRIGPWFDAAFTKKNYPNANAADLLVRRNAVVPLIDALNVMLADIAAAPRYAGKVFYVDLRNTLATPDEWANELHPLNNGFAKLAAKIDAALQAHI